ncbi:MAG: hypothetical protein IT435_03855 [Phycisphaerales bacterium]|nr:hypothetical protein [Phycisphaerales bacterium]
MTNPHRRLAGALLCTLSGAASAQEAMYTEAATMPSPGTLILREQVHYFKYGAHPIRQTDSTEQLELENMVYYGLARGLAVQLKVPVDWRWDEEADGGDEYDHGVSDLDVLFKWRIYQDDSGGINTLRLALLGGASFASGDDSDFSSGSINPHIGGVITKVWGRHGFNQDLMYIWNTGGDARDNFGGEGPDDAIEFNTAYLYRIAPGRFTSDSTGAWYVTAEVNGLYETNGDTELRFSPGLMFEGRTFGFELMAQLPLWNDLDERAELDLSLGIGVRFFF